MDHSNNDKTVNTQMVTFGCRLNNYESEIIGRISNKLKDTIIINTCAVTKEAERQARQAIRKAKRDNPGHRVLVTGCAAQINPKSFFEMPEVDYVIGNDLKMLKETYDNLPEERSIIVNDSVQGFSDHIAQTFSGKTRAFVQVQNGCDHSCTFCTIPLGRGKNRSVPLETIIQEVSQIIDNGYKEIVLTGVDITSYGNDFDKKVTLGAMVRELLVRMPQLERLRFTSLDPAAIDDDIVWLLRNEPRVMPHIHLSVQAGDNIILKRMKRRHLREDVMRVVNTLYKARSDLVIGADIIAGFPTETDEMFQNTIDLIEQCNIVFLHVFPFSPRPGTPAARMPQVKSEVIKRRAAILRNIGLKHMHEYFGTLIGMRDMVFMETPHSGKNRYFANVNITKEYLGNIGEAVEVEYTGYTDSALEGEIIELV